jgi:Tfp pilus assembly major pilin PilA
VVSIVTTLRAGKQRNHSSIPDKVKKFSLLRNVQTGSVTNVQTGPVTNVQTGTVTNVQTGTVTNV